MAIPELSETGVLPVGVHDTSIEEVGQRFGAFTVSDRRPNLFDRLSDYVAALVETGLVSAVMVDGSFVTSKPEPNDIDLIVILKKPLDFEAEPIAPTKYNALASSKVRRIWGFDVFFVLQDSPALDERCDFFQRIRESDGRKGVIRIWL